MTAPMPPRVRGHAVSQLARLAADPYAFYAEGRREHGNIFVAHVLGQQPWTVLGEPDAVRTVFRASADEMHSDADGIKYLIGPHSILLLDGESHRRERRAMTPAFRHERMLEYADRMLARCDDALDDARPGVPTTVHALVTRITLDVIVECVFGVSAPERRQRLAELTNRHLDAMQTAPMATLSMAVGGERLRGVIRWGTDRFRSAARIEGPLPEGPTALGRFFRTKAELDAMLRAELEGCRRAPEGRDDILSMLAGTSYDDGTAMTDPSVLDELFVLLVGGHETGAITLAWAMYFLARHPECMALARRELAEVFGDGPITARAAERLRYLPAVIDEAMRLRPVATSVARRLTVDTQVGPYLLPAGTTVNPAPAVLHFREDLFPDPHAFKPERFLDGKISPFHFMPFGGGSRACLGRAFALVEAKLLLANLLRRLDFELAPHANPQPRFRGLLVGPDDGVPIVVRAVAPRGACLPEVTGAAPHASAAA